jgi:type II secretory pathway pseudopilin PulG
MIKFLKQKNKRLTTGFTLVETLVAIAIFSMSILSLMVVLGGGISDATYAKRKMTAAYLAQEGIEYMRNMRDTLALSSETPGAGWDQFINELRGASCNANGCYIDDQNGLISCGENPKCAPLLYNSSNGKYNYTSGIDSGFSRRIDADPISRYEIKISSTVFWSQGSGNYSVTFSENLYNWIE